MFRSLVLIALSALAVLAAPVPDCPKQSRSMIPKPVVDFVSSLTKEDKAIIKEYGMGLSIENMEEALAALNAKSPSLAAKVMKMVKALDAKIEALGDEANAFVKALIKEIREQDTVVSQAEFEEKAKAILAKYEALSADARAELEQNFPITSFIFQVEELINLYFKDF